MIVTIAEVKLVIIDGILLVNVFPVTNDDIRSLAMIATRIMIRIFSKSPIIFFFKVCFLVYSVNY